MRLIDADVAIDKFEPWLKVKGYSEGELNMLKAVLYELTVMPSVQPELIAQDAYVRGFEQGRTQGKVDAKLQPERKWIPCSERLPDNRVDILICYRVWQQYAKRYVYSIVNGWYTRKYSVNENVFSEWEADCDYKEDEDEFYIQEGWYEFTTQGNGDLMNWYIGGAEVVAWMPLPEPYEEGDTNG